MNECEDCGYIRPAVRAFARRIEDELRAEEAKRGAALTLERAIHTLFFPSAAAPPSAANG